MASPKFGGCEFKSPKLALEAGGEPNLNFVRKGGHAKGKMIASNLVISECASDPRYKR